MRIQRLREYRERRGIPISELARRASLSRQTIYTIEAGGHTSIEVAQRLSRALEVGIGDLAPDLAEAVSLMATVRRRGRKPNLARRAEALALAQAGVAYTEIGRRLGVSRQRAHQLAGPGAPRRRGLPLPACCLCGTSVKRRSARFCSPGCRNAARRISWIATCEQCGAKFEHRYRPAAMRRGNRRFCSRPCRDTYARGRPKADRKLPGPFGGSVSYRVVRKAVNVPNSQHVYAQ